MMRDSAQRLGEHVTAALLGRLTPWAQRWRLWLAPAVRLVTRRRRPSPSAAAPWWRPTGTSMRCVTSRNVRAEAAAADPAAAVELINRVAGQAGHSRPTCSSRARYRAPHARDPGERDGAAAARHPANQAAFPAEVMTHTVAPGAIAGVNAFLVSDAAAPGSRAILPAYGA